MDIADRVAEESYAKRRKVGAIVVKDDKIISFGYNGTAPGDDNCCEDDEGKTKPDVIHAEMNAIMKLSKSTESSEGATMFCTLQPCLPCAMLIVGVGIKEVYYGESYKAANGGNAGLYYLNAHGVYTAQVSIDENDIGKSIFLIA